MVTPGLPLDIDGKHASAAEMVDALIGSLQPDSDIVIPISNGEPVQLLDALEDRADRLDRIRVHQMHALRDRRYLHGEFAGRLDHVSWFLSHITRPAFHEGTISFCPANFSEVPQLLLEKRPAAVIASVSPPDKHGYFSLGVSADYAASMIGLVPFVVEVNPSMPRTSGTNRLHKSEVLGWCEADTPLIEVPPPAISAEDCKIAEFVADRVSDRSTLQLGIGSIPTAVAGFLTDHRDLGIHTELLSDPVVDLVEAGAVTGLFKSSNRGRIVTTFALGTKRLYDFCDRNDLVQFLSVDEVNDPRNIGAQPRFVSINATLEVDLFGQCASESIGSHYWSGSGGQADFARGAQYSEGGDGFVVLRSTAKEGTISKIVPRLQPGAVVTTLKNTVDNVVTEYGVAELRGRSLAERARNLISVAAPQHREHLEAQAVEMKLLGRGARR